MKRFTILLLCVFGSFLYSTAQGASINLSQLDWSVQYLIDTSQPQANPQSPYPRDNRGLAISPDGRYLYAGYNNSLNSSGEVRKIDLLESDYIDAHVATAAGIRGKGISVDDQGRVYIAEDASILVYDADLTTVQHTITMTGYEYNGISVHREGDGSLAVYATSRNNSILDRWTLTENSGEIINAVLAGLDGDGEITVTGASSLRGMEVDSAGNIWMADKSANKVFRVDSSGGNLTSATVSKAMDLDFDGDQVFVTQYDARTITVLDMDMSILDTLSVPWAGLSLDPDGQSADGALSGIVVLPGERFYVSNETGQTADEKSIYGRTDGNSGYIGDQFYTDLYFDDNDPILVCVPEPGTLALLAFGALGIYRRRK